MIDSREHDPKPANIYGEALADWFRLRGRDMRGNALDLQLLTELAHRNVQGRAGQMSLIENQEYYSHWMAWIYAQANIAGRVPMTELEQARLYMMEYVLQRGDREEMR